MVILTTGLRRWRSRRDAEALEPEKIHRQRRSAVERQLREGLTDSAGTLEAMPAESAGDDHVWMSGMTVDDELVVRAVGVHANAQRQQRSIGCGNEIAENAADCVFIRFVNVSV